MNSKYRGIPNYADFVRASRTSFQAKNLSQHRIVIYTQLMIFPSSIPTKAGRNILIQYILIVVF
jgi:hypothetical protein